MKRNIPLAIKKIGVLFVLILLSLMAAPFDSIAQEGTDWTFPVQIPGYDTDAEARIVADSSGTIHAFTNKLFEGELLVVYSKWIDGRGWTDPVDIFLPQLKSQSRVADVFLDDQGTFHLAFFSGDDQGAAYYYSKAHVTEANQSTAWTNPVIIADQASTPATSALIGDKAGNPLFLYHSDIAGNGLYAVHSLDRGDTWSGEPDLVFQTNGVERWPSSLKVYIDDIGLIHAVWGMADVTGNSLAVFYSQVAAANAGWKEPIVLDRADGFEADTPAIIKYDGDLFVIYHNSFPTTRWMRRSSDDGATWSEPIKIFPKFQGTNGPASMIIDGNNELRVFFGNRTNGAQTFGMWQSIWDGNRWGIPEPVIAGDRVQDDQGGIGFDPSHAEARILNGNHMFLAWTTDPGAGRNGVWFSHKRLEIPPIPSILLPTVTAIPTATPEIIPSPEPTRDPTGGLTDLDFTPPSQSPSLANGMLIGVGVSLILLIFLLSFKLIVRSRS